MHYCPDGILTSALLLETLEDENLEMSKFVAEAPVYRMIRKTIAVKNMRKHGITKQLENCLKTAFPEHKEVSDIDGVRLVLEEGWILVRASGTEPIIRLTVEAESMRTANKIMEKGIIPVRKLVEE
jgi:phosphoglucosamine mutase